MKVTGSVLAQKAESLAEIFDLGANRLPNGQHRFKVWAPRCGRVVLKVLHPDNAVSYEMQRDDQGYFTVTTPPLSAGTRYVYSLNGVHDRPDPAGRGLPVSVHGPSEIVDPQEFPWTDKRWKGRDLSGTVFYEAHIGTFTSEGTFQAAINKIPHLKALGVTCLEIMPVARCPGSRNWGYDGVGLFAVQPSYGGPNGLKELVNACHMNGIAVCLDVVYNHLGPEGNYLREFGPYFTNKYPAAWGESINFDGWDSDPVRHFMTSNACFWVREYHIDCLRLDAVHAIYDFSAKHILRQINEAVKEEASRLKRKVLVIAESDLNDSRVIRSVENGGYGLCGQWSDDFHHAVHALLTRESNGYYRDFGKLDDLAKAFTDGFVYDGRYSAFRHRAHGDQVKDLPAQQLVVSIQNHDQVGNRPFADRFGTLLSFEARKMAASLLLLSPNTPMLFMGEEFGEKAPFHYFIDHEDQELVRRVREGRQRDFASFGWHQTADPKAEATFLQSKLHWDWPQNAESAALFKLYQDLIKLRKRYGFANARVKRAVMSDGSDAECIWLAVEYALGKGECFGAVFSFGRKQISIPNLFKSKKFHPCFSSQSKEYGGTDTRTHLQPSHEIALAPMRALFGRISN